MLGWYGASASFCTRHRAVFAACRAIGSELNLNVAHCSFSFDVISAHNVLTTNGAGAKLTRDRR